MYVSLIVSIFSVTCLVIIPVLFASLLYHEAHHLLRRWHFIFITIYNYHDKLKPLFIEPTLQLLLVV